MSEPLHRHILRTLEQAGYQAYIVGGYVRDHLLGRESKDIDIATSATPGQVQVLFPNSEMVGAHFGVVLVKGDNGESIEVATFRVDGAYENGRHPSEVRFTASLQEDVQRRDFTINALAMDIDGKVIDHVGGLADLNSKVIRTVGHPFERFDEDHLRMMRAVRFACQLKFRLHDQTRSAIGSHARSLPKVSAERIQQELSRILLSGKAAYGVRILHGTNILVYTIPEVSRMAFVDQDPLHHPEGDVFTHTLGLLVKLKKDCSLTLALAALLHDIGKPQTKGEKNGHPTFYGHEEVGAELTRGVLNRLKYPNEVISTVVSHVAQHMDFRLVTQLRKSKLYRFLGQENFAELLELHKLDAMSGSCDMTNAEFVEKILAEIPPEVIRPERLVTGRDLIAMGLEPGPVFRTLLERVEIEQLEGNITTRDAALAFMANTLGTSKAAMESATTT